MNTTQQELRIAKTIDDLEIVVLDNWRDVLDLEINYPEDLSRLMELFRIKEYEEVIVDNQPRFASERQKIFIYMRDKKSCAYCDIWVDIRSVHADHLVPFSKGGSTLVENLVCACKRCNYAKGAMDPCEFIETLEEEGLGWRDNQYRATIENIREQRGYDTR